MVSLIWISWFNSRWFSLGLTCKPLYWTRLIDLGKYDRFRYWPRLNRILISLFFGLFFPLLIAKIIKYGITYFSKLVLIEDFTLVNHFFYFFTVFLNINYIPFVRTELILEYFYCFWFFVLFSQRISIYLYFFIIFIYWS